MENIKLSARAKKLIHTVIIVDTSVLIKNFIKEEDSDFVDELISLHQRKELTLLSTPLLQFEFFNVLSNKFKDKARVRQSLKRFLSFGIGIIDAKYGYLEKAIENACEARVSYYDSSYHALAKDMDGVFLTADKKYFDITENQGNILLLSNP